MEEIITATQTTQLQEESRDVVAQAQAVIISDKESYEKAQLFANSLKSVEKKIKAFWAEPKQKAYEAHKAITDQEKAMLDPVKTAIKELNDKSSAYVMECERKRKAAEKEAQRKAEEEKRKKEEEAERLRAEAERLHAEAEKAAADGNIEAADAALMAEAETLEASQEAAVQAEAFENAAVTLKVEADTPKVDGVSYRKDWKVSVTKEDDVPVSFMGAVLRPVDLAKVKELVKLQQGKIEIPGIAVKETLTPVRRG